MKRRPFPPRARALAAFAGTVAVALLAAASSLLAPDVAIMQSVDSMALLTDGLDQFLPASLFE